MPATIQDLKKVRQELISKTPLLYQGEIYENWSYTNDGTDLKDNNPIELKIALLKEAINIWDNKTYNLSNIQKAFKNTSTNVGNWEIILKRWLDLKTTLKLADWDNKGYIERRRAMPSIYSDYDNEITALEADKTQLTTDKATAEASLKSYKDNLGTETPEALKAKITALSEAKTKAEQERDNRPNINLTDYKKLQDNQEKHTDYDQIKQDLGNWTSIFWTKNPEGVKDWWTNIKKEWDGDFEKVFDNFTFDNLKKVKAELDKLADKDAEIKKLKEQQASQGSESVEKLNKVSRKLMGIYNEQIKQATELFYQELSLDNNWINEKYGDKSKPYLDLLGNTSTDSEPEQVINAFRIVALITATGKAQETHEQYKDKITGLPKQLKKMNLNKFKKIKETWELLEGEPKEENNPLYLPIIKEKQTYINKINEIINLWQ